MNVCITEHQEGSRDVSGYIIDTDKLDTTHPYQKRLKEVIEKAIAEKDYHIPIPWVLSPHDEELYEISDEFLISPPCHIDIRLDFYLVDEE